LVAFAVVFHRFDEVNIEIVGNEGVGLGQGEGRVDGDVGVGPLGQQLGLDLL
jgi:hypothetical protein